MTSPRLRMSLIDPGAIARPVSLDQVPILYAVAADGPIGEVRRFTRPEKVIETYVRGHLVDGALYALSEMAEIRVCRVEATVEGSVDIVDDTDSALILDSVTGTPTQYLSIRIEALNAATVASGNLLVKYSLDAWDIEGIEPTYSRPVAVPASGEIALADTGLTVTLDGEAENIGDAVVASTHPGHYGATEIAALKDTVKVPQASGATFMCFGGDAETATEANTNLAAIAALLSALFVEHIVIGAMAGTGHEGDGAVVTATENTNADPPFLSAGHGAAYVVNPRSATGRGRIALRQHEIAMVRAATNLISTDLGRTASGPIRNMLGTDYDAAFEGDTLHDARVSAFRTWEPRASGFFIQRQLILSKEDSNFISWPHAAVMMAALRAADKAAFPLILETLRTQSNGTMDPADVADIDAAMARAIESVLMIPRNVTGRRGHASAFSALVARDVELPSVEIEVRIRPVDWPTDILVTLQYSAEV